MTIRAALYPCVFSVIIIFVIQHSYAQVKKHSTGFAPDVFDNTSLVQKYQQIITPESLSAHLYILASDSLEGRETGTRGQRMAAEYLASQYHLMGLTPKGIVLKNSASTLSKFYQPFYLYRTTPKEFQIDLIVNGKKYAGSRFSDKDNDDLSYYLSGGANATNSAVVFAGYGIADSALAYDDYKELAAKKISINNKWLLMLADEPASKPGTSLLSTVDHKPSSWSGLSLIKRRYAALKSGNPKGILLITDAAPGRTKPFSEDAVQSSIRAKRIGNLSHDKINEVLQVYAVSVKFANEILQASGKTVDDLKLQINNTLLPEVLDIPNTKINLSVKYSDPLPTGNVIAYIEGSDPKVKNEVIVISAHLDHLGIDPGLKGDQIFNGAADDGSGIAATLELAKAFQKAKQEGFGPRRSIAFINFTGEEKSLLGSYYFMNRSSIIAHDKIVADINMDGVGGIDKNHPTHSNNYIYIAGTPELSTELININKKVSVATASNVELTNAPPGFNSDDRNFRDNLIPFIYFSTGFTEHYHKVSDEPNTIDYNHLAQVTRLIFANAWQIANQNQRIKRPNKIIVKNKYICSPCGLDCDGNVYDHPGHCPVCGMALIKKTK